MASDVLPVDFHLRAVMQHAFDHGGDLGGGTGLELGVDAGGFALCMPVDHDAGLAISSVPFCHEILVPRPEMPGIWRTCGGPFAPDFRQTHRKDAIDDLRNGLA